MSHDNKTFYFETLPNGWLVGRFRALDGIDGVVHAVTTRKGPDVMVAAKEPGKAASTVADALALCGVAFCKQVHGKEICVPQGRGLAGPGDGLVSAEPELGVMGFSADCPLILVADPISGAIGVAHASWRGTVARIATEIVVKMASRFGTDPKDIVACICPSAGPCCYEVGPDVLQKATETLGLRAEQFFQTRAGKMYFDLWAANVDELERSGLSPGNIHTAGVCTICRNDLFPSHRMEKDAAGRFVAVIGVR